jgi:hypothetical protein
MGNELVRADIGNMHIDPLPEDIRVYLKAHFTDVEDELQQGDYYVFGLKTTSGLPRRLKVHRHLFMFSGMNSVTSASSALLDYPPLRVLPLHVAVPSCCDASRHPGDWPFPKSNSAR